MNLLQVWFDPGVSDTKRARFLFLSSACSVLIHFSKTLSPTWLLAATPWLFPSRFKSTKSEQISFPQEFKTRAQELRFWSVCLTMGQTPWLGRGRMLNGLAWTVCS